MQRAVDRARMVAIKGISTLLMTTDLQRKHFPY